MMHVGSLENMKERSFANYVINCFAQVTEANMKLMKQLILNGADKHPGANFIQQRQTSIRK